MKKTTHRGWLFIGIVLLLFLTGCGGGGKGDRPSTPVVRTPTADGTVTEGNEAATLDASHTDSGYVMVNYTGQGSKVKLQITLPQATVYTYDLHGGWETFPLTGGDGTYTVAVLENVAGNQYTTAFSTQIAVTLSNAFSPFLYPSQYVWYTADSQVVGLSQDLARGASTDLDVITAVYDYIIGNISYDNDLAANATADYLPEVDRVLSSKKGICFDYAATMTALLRLQDIPTRLEIGYAGSAYHAWISVYTKEEGWVENIIHFDGKSWSLMDPTLAANNDNDAVKNYIGDGSTYQALYIY